MRHFGDFQRHVMPDSGRWRLGGFGCFSEGVRSGREGDVLLITSIRCKFLTLHAHFFRVGEKIGERMVKYATVYKNGQVCPVRSLFLNIYGSIAYNRLLDAAV